MESYQGSIVDEFAHQIAGHTNETVKRLNNKYILKPQNKPNLFKREVEFYTRTFNNLNDNSSAAKFVPQFHGVIDIANMMPARCPNGSETSIPCIILDDLTINYETPCLIDIKMGQQTFEPTASADKISRELRKYPYQEEIGFRITGLKVWNKIHEHYAYYDKHFGRSLLPEQVLSGLALFLHNGETFRKDVLRELIIKLDELLEFMKQQRSHKFYCSSLLIVYDAASLHDIPSKSSEDIDHSRSDRNSNETTTTEGTEGSTSQHLQQDTAEILPEPSQSHPPMSTSGPEYTSSTSLESSPVTSSSSTSPICRVAMIDFAHTLPNRMGEEDFDTGYIYGLSSLLEKLQKLQNLSELESSSEQEEIETRSMCTVDSESSFTSPMTSPPTPSSPLLSTMLSLQTKYQQTADH
jgi:1D-myo-inositol-tetrakisphosphate 5-kinase/inositol-polyphosphate multikinase